MQQRIERAWADTITVPLQFLDYPESEHGLDRSMIQYMKAYESRIQVVVSHRTTFLQSRMCGWCQADFKPATQR